MATWHSVCISDSVYVFDEGETEQDVLRVLWEEWVVGYEHDDNEAANEYANTTPTWELLHDVAGDFLFEFEERVVKVKGTPDFVCYEAGEV